MKKNEIDWYRQKINKIDEKIVKLLNQRLHLAKAIGNIKHNLGLPVFDPVRENEVYKKINSLNSIFPQELLDEVYSNIMAAARAIERKLKIIYLGPAGSFTHIAAKKKFKDAELLEANSIVTVFTEVEKNIGDYGIVPIENSNNGVVTNTLDKLLTTSLNIVGEILSKVSHNLISKEKKIENVRIIYSHPQVFGQCENWISANFKNNIQLVPVESTALAAELAAKNKNVAAIASELAAEIYKLNTLAKNIEDYKNNTTRF
ncbi:MAG TPA: prephenate dehydratase domain-containing protein, partial [bacterium]|nr:prephenate dehydratase domain-containing protein [bacterium]